MFLACSRTGAEWWAAQLAAGRKPTVVSMAWSCHRLEAVLGLLISCGYGLLNVVVRPLLLKLTVDAVTQEIEAPSDVDHTVGATACHAVRAQMHVPFG